MVHIFDQKTVNTVIRGPSTGIFSSHVILIILICWFGAQKTFLLSSMWKTVVLLIFFVETWWIESSKEKYLFKIENFVALYMSLLYPFYFFHKVLILNVKNLTDPKLLTGSVTYSILTLCI